MQGLRFWLKRHLAWIRIPIQSGPLRGRLISGFCGIRFIRGTYDQGGVKAFTAMVAPGMTVYDIGAHVGYLSMVASHLVGASGRVVAFEPLGLNLQYLRGHLRANGMSNVAVIDACVSDVSGRVGFDRGRGTGRGRASTSGAAEFRSVAIDEEVREHRLPPPGMIKLDVEGAELDVLRGSIETLRRHRPSLIVSVHSAQLLADCSALLSSIGYDVTRLKSNQLCATSRGDKRG